MNRKNVVPFDKRINSQQSQEVLKKPAGALNQALTASTKRNNEILGFSLQMPEEKVAKALA